jgi:hypothetical protein
MRLVSCSLDCTICIWQEGWTVEHRLGQFLGNKNAYFDIEVHGNYLIALNYIGSVLIWKYNGS